MPSGSGLVALAESKETGLCLLGDPSRRSLHMFNHLEYDATTLADEYFRDAGNDPHAPLPCNYFPGDDPAQQPVNCWRSHAHLLFGNWINEIYRTTPFDQSSIGFRRWQATNDEAVTPPRGCTSI
jgi:homoserine O-succinyltransferase/O-acetyltransferase